MRFSRNLFVASWVTLFLTSCSGSVSVPSAISGDGSATVTVSFGDTSHEHESPDQEVELEQEMATLRKLSTNTLSYSGGALFDRLGKRAEHVIPELEELSKKPLIPALDRLSRIRSPATAAFLLEQLKPIDQQGRSFDWNETVRAALARTGETSVAVQLFSQPYASEELAYLMPDDAVGAFTTAFDTMKKGDLGYFIDNVVNLLVLWPHRFSGIRTSPLLVEAAKQAAINNYHSPGCINVNNSVKALLLQDSSDSKIALVHLLNTVTFHECAIQQVAAAQPPGYELAAFNRMYHAKSEPWTLERLDEALNNIPPEEATEALVAVVGQKTRFDSLLKKLDDLDPELAAKTALAVFQSEDDERREVLYREITGHETYSPGIGRMLARLYADGVLDELGRSTSIEEKEAEIVEAIARSLRPASLLPWLKYQRTAYGEPAEQATPFRKAILDLAIADPTDWAWMKEHEAHQIRAAYRIAQAILAGEDGNAALIEEFQALEGKERTEAAYALRYLKPPPTALLIELLKDGNEEVAGLACSTLLYAALQNIELHETLKKHHMPETIRVCRMFTNKEYLLPLLDETSVPLLIDRLARELGGIHRSDNGDILDLLARLTGQNFGHDLDGWRSWCEEHCAVAPASA